MSTPTEELDSLFGHAPKLLTLGGATYRVRPVTLRQLPAFARLFEALVPAGQQVAEITLARVAEHSSLIAETLAALTGGTPDAILDLDADDLLRLVGALIAENIDFFARRIAPALGDIVTGISAALPPASGQPPSPSSSPAATA